MVLGLALVLLVPGRMEGLHASKTPLGYLVSTSGEFDLRLISRDVLSKLKVYSDKLVYTYGRDGEFFVGAIPWRFQPKPGSEVVDCFMLRYSYGTGSDKRLIIIGPGRGGKWGPLLDVEISLGRFVQPEFVDFDGWGSCDILLQVPPSVNDRYLRTDKSGKFTQNPVQDCEWSYKLHKYVLVATVPFSRRFYARKPRTRW